MSLFSESFLYRAVKTLSAIFCRLPYRFSIAVARAVGGIGYYLMKRKRDVVETNLRTVFSSTKSPREIRRLNKEVFKNLACTFMDTLCLPKIKREGVEKTMASVDHKYVVQALSAGRGCILMSIHSGSWELAVVVSSSWGYSYNVVANEQKKAPLMNELLNDYRRVAGAKIIPPGSATRDIIRTLKANEIVTLVLDQGGHDGTPVEFLGKTASMSTGAIRLGLKYQVPICPVWMERFPDGRQELRIFPPLKLETTGDSEKDILVNTQKAARLFEGLIRNHPWEYMWFYKFYKYTTQADVLILGDGKTGHLRQSQAAAETLRSVLRGLGKEIRLKEVTVEFRNSFCQKMFLVYCLLAQSFGFFRKEEVLKLFLSVKSYEAVMSIKPDFIISCGSQTAGVNFILSRLRSIKSIHILKSGVIDWSFFSLLILPEHDKPLKVLNANLVLTKVALNLITPEYLKQQSDALLLRYSHLRNNVRSKIGVLLGGNTKGVIFDPNQIRLLIRQLKEAANHFNMDLLITTSRRTPAVVDEVIIKELRNFNRCSLLVVANESNIPEAVGGILALSDLLIVSGESISMVSEALSSGKKTIVFAPTGNYVQHSFNKYDHFVFDLNQQGYLLATSIKDVSSAITQALNQKIFIKKIEDKERVFQAIKGITI